MRQISVLYYTKKLELEKVKSLADHTNLGVPLHSFHLFIAVRKLAFRAISTRTFFLPAAAKFRLVKSELPVIGAGPTRALSRHATHRVRGEPCLLEGGMERSRRQGCDGVCDSLSHSFLARVERRSSGGLASGTVEIVWIETWEHRRIAVSNCCCRRGQRSWVQWCLLVDVEALQGIIDGDLSGNVLGCLVRH